MSSEGRNESNDAIDWSLELLRDNNIAYEDESDEIIDSLTTITEP